MKLFKKQAETAQVLGKKFHCIVCKHDKFYLGRAMLNTTLLTLFKLDWVNRTAAHLTCEKCGHIAWFDQ